MRALVLFLLVILGFVAFKGQAEQDVDTIENSNSLPDKELDSEDEDLNASKRVFGGQSDFQNKYDFVARLTVEFNTRMTTVCSGVVLTTKIIITVAHCLKHPGGEMVNRVIATLPRGGPYIFQRDEVLIHPSYENGYGADVALLRKNIRHTQFMKGYGTPPSIPEQTLVPYSPAGGELATIVGWGQIPGSTQYVNRLRWARVSLITTADCRINYPAYNDIADKMYDDEMLCTGASIAGACTGDWGGPLLTGNNVLQGLTMYRSGECTSQYNTPTAYFSVERVGDWIRTLVR